MKIEDLWISYFVLKLDLKLLDFGEGLFEVLLQLLW